MNEPEPVRVETEIAEFAAILSTGHGEEVPVIVGGHAAGLWSRYYLARGIAELEGFVPFRSKDLDLLGTMSILESLHRRFKGKLTLSEPRSPVFGRLEIPRHGGGFLRVEVLHTVLGLRAKDLKRTVVVEVDGVAGRIPLPHLVLKAKLANAALLSQEGRQDVKHTRMMLLCVRGFVADLVANLRDGELGERPVVNLLEEIRETVCSREAAKAASLWGFDFSAIWPMDELRCCGSDKVARWLAHRFP